MSIKYTYKVRKQYMLERRRNHLKMCIEYKQRVCAICGRTWEPEMFDFHHVNPQEKSFGIAGNLTRSWNSLRKELDKCQLLCVNCHRKTFSNVILIFNP